MTALQAIPNTQIASFEQAVALRDQIVWGKLEGVTVESALNDWLATLSERTQVNYQSGINMLAGIGLVNPLLSLQAFSLVNHEAIIDRIKQLPYLQETTKQARAALYISFTRFLSRRFPTMFKKAMPSREGAEKTFFRVHDKVVTEAMNQAQWTAFFSALQKINPRDCLIAKIVLQGGKRIREVLHLSVDQINWDNREITFKQSKTRGVQVETVISYPETIMQALREYIGDRQGFVFLGSKGNPVILNQVANTFARAGKVAGITFKVTPHVLRASAVTYLKQQGFADSDIMKVTGHASSEMVNAYDKTSRADNPSKKVSLVS